MDSELFKSLLGLSGIPFILALTQLLKPFIGDTRWYPVIALAFGLALNIAIAWVLGADNRADILAAAILGIMAGLAASGIYSGVSTLKEGPMADKDRRRELPPSPRI